MASKNKEAIAVDILSNCAKKQVGKTHHLSEFHLTSLLPHSWNIHQLLYILVFTALAAIDLGVKNGRGKQILRGASGHLDIILGYL